MWACLHSGSLSEDESYLPLHVMKGSSELDDNGNTLLLTDGATGSTEVVTRSDLAVLVDPENHANKTVVLWSQKPIRLQA